MFKINFKKINLAIKCNKFIKIKILMIFLLNVSFIFIKCLKINTCKNLIFKIKITYLLLEKVFSFYSNTYISVFYSRNAFYNYRIHF